MNSRVSNPESYIFSAIIYIGKDNFTSNDVAQILIERFSLPKSYFKAKAFAYNQIQCLVRKGLLSKVRKSGAYQYVYSVTSEFNVVKESVELIEVPQKNSCQLVLSATSHEYRNVNIQIRTLIEKYSSELEKVSGAKDLVDHYNRRWTVSADQTAGARPLRLAVSPGWQSVPHTGTAGDAP